MIHKYVIRKYAEIFCWKNVSSFCSAKATHIFSAKNIKILCIESAKTVNEMTLNELVKLTTLWTTGPCSLRPYWMGILCTPWIEIHKAIFFYFQLEKKICIFECCDWHFKIQVKKNCTPNCYLTTAQVVLLRYGNSLLSMLGQIFHVTIHPSVHPSIMFWFLLNLPIEW